MRKSVSSLSLIIFVVLSLVSALSAQSLVPSPTGTWTLTGAMSQARSGAAATTVSGGAVLVTGGTDSSGTILATAEIYGAKGTFTTVAPMNVARTGHTVTWLEDVGYVLVTGGTTTGGVITGSAELYDPDTNVWTLLTPMVDARTGHPATPLPNSSVLLSGGTNASGFVSSLERFNYASQQFAFIDSLPTARKDHAAAALLNGRVLLVGGTDASGTLATTEIYDPLTNTLTPGQDLLTPRAKATATTLLDGTVLIAGGVYPEGAVANGNIAELQSAEIFDPATGKVTAVSAKMANARASHQAFLLPNNNSVLLVGGTYNGEDLATAELYIPWKGGFSATGSMSAARSSATGAALFPLADGQLLVAGGSNQGSAELYGFATVQTDKTDYVPGDIVIINGTGWKPSETVTVTIHETTGKLSDQTVAIKADANGKISDSSVMIEPADSKLAFLVTAVGAAAQAQTEFWDASLSSMSVDNSPLYVAAGGTAAFSVTVNSNDWFTQENGNVVLNSVSPATATITASPVSFNYYSYFGDSNSVTFNVATTASTPIGTYTLTVGNTETASVTATASLIVGTAPTISSPPTNQTTTYGGSASFTASANGTPAATVQWQRSTNGGSSFSNLSNATSTTYSLSNVPLSYSGYQYRAVFTNAIGSVTSSAATLTVSQAPLTVSGITASSKTYDRTTTATINTSGATLSARLNGDSVSLRTTSATGAFSDKTVGTAKTVQISGLTITGSGSGNYTLVQPTTTANITAKALTVSGITAATKVYDATTAATFNTGSAVLSGVISGDTVSVAGATGIFSSKAIGTGKAVTVSAVTLGGADGGNYTVTNPTGLTANITVAGLTVSGITANNKTYDGTTAASLNTTSAALAGVISGDTVTIGTSGATGVFSSKNAATGTAVTVSGVTISGTDSGNYSLTQPTGLTANITAKALTVSGLSASSKTYDATNKATLTGTAALQTAEAAGSGNTSDGKPYTGDTVTLGGTAAGTFASAGVGSAIAVTVTGITVSNANYTVTQPTGLNANITAKALTVSGLTASAKTYDGTTTATFTGSAALLTAEAAGAGTSSDGKPYTGDAVNVGGTEAGTFASKNVGTAVAVTVTGVSLSGAQSGNYTVTQPTGLTANITAKALTASGLTANSKTYDGTTAATLTGSAALQPTEAAGSGTNSDGKPYTGDTVNITGTATGSFVSSGAGSAITVNIGGLSLAGSNAGNYSLTAPTSSANITAKSLTVSGIGASNKTYDGTTAATLTGTPGTLVGVVGTDSVSLSGTAIGTFASAGVGNGIVVTVSGQTLTGANAGNYSLTEPTTAANITKATPTVNPWPTASAITYGQTLASSNLSGGSASVGGSFTFTTPTTAPGAGTALQSVTFTPTDTANYNSVPGTASVTVGKATATVALGGLSQSYDQTAKSATATTNPQGLTVTFTYNGSSTAPAAAGSYTVIGTVVDANYQGSATGTMIVSQALATVTLSNLNWTYDGTPKAASVSTQPTGLFVVPSYTGVSPTAYGPAADAPTNPGTYSVTATVVDPNYTGVTTGTLTINKLDPGLNLALLTGMPEPSPYGTRVYFELAMAKVPVCPTGQVQFSVDGSAAGAPVVLTGSNCTQPVEFQTATLIPGSHTVTATYSGDVYYNGNTSGTVTHEVTADTVAVTLGVSGSSVNVGYPVTFTATVTPTSLDPAAVPPAGTVQFIENGVPIGTSALGTTAPYTATFTTASLPAGVHSIKATYVNTDGLFAGSSSAVTTETVNKIAPAIVWANPADIVYGTKLDHTKLNATATDSVTNQPITGTFVYNPAADAVLAIGPRTLNVTFTPDDAATYTSQTATVSINVTPAVLTVTADSLSRVYGVDNPSLTYKITGFVNNETAASIITGEPALTTTAVAASQVNTYPITAAVGTLVAPNYSFTYVPGTLTVTAATLTVKADDSTRAYGLANPTFTGTLTGLVTGDNITATFSTTATVTSGVGGYPIKGTLVDPDGKLVNYTVTNTPGNLTVTAAALTVTADAKSKVYGSTDPALTYKSSGLVNGDALSGSLTRALGETVGTYTILQGTLTAGGNYTINYIPANLGITAASASVTPNPATKVYATGDPAFSGTLSGFLPSDNVTATYTRTAGENVAGSPYVIGATLSPTSVLSNYDITYNTASFIITQATATVILDNLIQTYDGQPKPVTVTTVPSPLGLSYSYTGITPTNYPASLTPPTDPGNYAVAVSVVDANYIGQASGTLTINKLDPALSLALLTGMPEPSPYGTRVYFELAMAKVPCPTGEVQFAVDGSAAGAPVVLTGTNCTQPVEFQTATLIPGSHTVTATYSGDVYYNGNTSGTVTHEVTADTVAVTLGVSGSSVNVGYPVTFTATVTPTSLDPAAVPPAGTVQFIENGVPIGSSALGTTSPYTATFTTSSLPAGVHSITATYVNTDGLFAGSSSAVTTETVNKIAPAIAWANPADIVYGTKLDNTQLNAVATDSVTNQPITGTFVYDPAADAVLAIGPRTLNVTFTPTDQDTYTSQTATVSINVTPAVLTVTADSLSRVYGVDNPTLTYTITGFVNGEDVSVVTGAPALTTTAVVASPVNTYPITAAAGTLVAPNYSFTYVPGTLTVTSAALSIGIQPATKVYGTANPTFTPTYTGLVNGDTPAALTGTLTYTTAVTAASGMGAYPVTPGGVTSANYTITFVPGTLTVGQATLTVTANNQSRIFGAANPTLTYTITAFVNGDTSSAVTGAASCTTTATTSSQAGPYPITCTLGTLASTNYSFSFVAGTLTISSLDLVETGVAVTGTAVSGGNITVADTTTNEGNEAAEASTTIFYLSPDGVAKGLNIGTRNVGALAAGVSSIGSTSVTLPLNLTGTYYVIACANGNSAIAESNTLNNCTASPSINVVSIDLFVQSGSVTVTGVAVSGGTLSVTDTTSNQGSGTAGSSYTVFYLSTDGSTKGANVGTRTVAALASGGSSAGTTVVTLPTNLTGTYYVIACANGNSTVIESNAANNCTASASFNVVSADLIVQSGSVAVTGTPISGGSISVTDTTTNQGSGAVGASATLFYLSTDGTTKGAILGTRNVTALASGASSAGTSTVTLPTNLTGSYYVIACANGNNVIIETTSANNCTASSPFSVVSTDLIVQSGSVTVTGTAVSGGNITVTDTTTNQGSGTANASSTVLYLSTNGTTKGATVGARNVGALGAGISSSGTTTVSLPANLIGSYYVIACANGTNTVIETTSANNCTASPLFNVVSVDLIVQGGSVTVTGTAVSGGTLSVTDTTTNQGGGTASASSTLFYLSSDGIAKSVYVGARSVGALAAGGSSAGTTTVTVPASLSGTYYLLACANGTSTVAETNTANNCTASPSFNVAKSVDLIVQSGSVVITGAAASGGSITVADTTVNQGTGAAGASYTFFYLSIDGTTKGANVGSRHPGALAAGASSAGTTTMILPTNLMGTYYMIACANGNSGIVESNIANNCTTSAPFSVAGADLVVQSGSVRVTGTMVAGTKVTVTDTTTDSGSGGAPGSYTFFYLSVDGVGKGSSAGSRSVSALATGASSVGSTTLTLPSNLTGTYYMLACANGNGGVIESNTANNCTASAAFTITH